MGTRLAMLNSAMMPRLEASWTWVGAIQESGRSLMGSVGISTYGKSHETQGLVRAQGEGFELPSCLCQL